MSYRVVSKPHSFTLIVVIVDADDPVVLANEVMVLCVWRAKYVVVFMHGKNTTLPSFATTRSGYLCGGM